jgi:5-methylcytosine-specific restriction endonuclease McrA
MKRHNRSAHAVIFALLLFTIERNRQRKPITFNRDERAGPIRCRSHSKEKRRRIIGRDRSTCYLCGARRESNELVLDHIIPRSRGGTNQDSNLAVACYPCDAFKADRLLGELTWPG